MLDLDESDDEDEEEDFDDDVDDEDEVDGDLLPVDFTSLAGLDFLLRDLDERDE